MRILNRRAAWTALTMAWTAVIMAWTAKCKPNHWVTNPLTQFLPTLAQHHLTSKDSWSFMAQVIRFPLKNNGFRQCLPRPQKPCKTNGFCTLVSNLRFFDPPNAFLTFSNPARWRIYIYIRQMTVLRSSAPPKPLADVRKTFRGSKFSLDASEPSIVM